MKWHALLATIGIFIMPTRATPISPFDISTNATAYVPQVGIPPIESEIDRRSRARLLDDYAFETSLIDWLDIFKNQPKTQERSQLDWSHPEGCTAPKLHIMGVDFESACLRKQWTIKNLSLLDVWTQTRRKKMLAKYEAGLRGGCSATNLVMFICEDYLKQLMKAAERERIPQLDGDI